MDMQKPSSDLTKIALYGIGGFVFGFFFPLLGVFIDLIMRGLALTPGNVLFVIRNQPLHWLILTAIPILTTLAVLFGNRQVRLLRFSTELEDIVSEKTASYEKVIDALEVELKKGAQLEEIISRGKKEWEAIFDSLLDILVVTDETGTIVRCNLATIRQLNTTFQNIISQNVHQVFYGENSDKEILPGDVQFPASLVIITVLSFLLNMPMRRNVSSI